MIVVADTSPLIALSTLGLHELLHLQYGEILIPPAVWSELSARPEEPFRAELLGAPWLVRHAPANRPLINSLHQTLGAGEAEAIALCVERNAIALIMDERLGRRAAARFGIRPIGVIGILVQAKNRGDISAISPLLDQLHQQAGFRLNPALIQRVLADCGEA